MTARRARNASQLELEPNSMLAGRYRIVRTLGQGGMGTVYEGEHRVIKRRVAIKVLHPEHATNPDVVMRFVREAQAVTMIGHPNIVEVTDFGQLPDGDPFMVLEYLEGRDYRTDLENEGPQPLGKTARIAIQVCRALGAAHAKGIIHRDLKPENIFLARREGDPHFVKVLDFGVSKFQGNTANMIGELRRTDTGIVLGTPFYMSPEQYQGSAKIDHRADLYSIGVILFEALAGRYPFLAQSLPQLVLAVSIDTAPDIRNFRPDLPEPIARLTAALLDKNPDARPASCADVEAALVAYANDTSGAPFVAYEHSSDSRPIPQTSEIVERTAPVTAPQASPIVAPGVPPTSYSARSTEPKRSSIGRAFSAVGAFALLLLLGGAIALVYFPPPNVARERREHREERARRAPRVEAPPMPVAPAPVAPTPALVHVRIEATPARARIELGTSRGTGSLETDVPLGETRDLRVSAAGYQPHQDRITFDRPGTYERAITLARPAISPRARPPRNVPSMPTLQPVSRRMTPPSSRSSTPGLAGTDDIVHGRPQ